jgi:hypothetical protein
MVIVWEAQKMDTWMIGYNDGKRAAAQYFEENIKGSFNPHQVAIILRAFADITEPLELANAGKMTPEALEHYLSVFRRTV